MSDEATTAQLAREHAKQRLAEASAALTKAADTIAETYKVPEGINGLSRGEFLGRVSFVVSMERDLRRAGEDLFAQQVIRNQLLEADPEPEADLDKLPVTGSQLGQNRAEFNDAMPIEQVPGLTVQMVKALNAAGIHQVAEVDKFTDEALLKVPGIAGPSLAKIRASVAAVRG